jgi:hypothetical protein
MYLKPKLVNNWPQVRDDTEIVAHRIKDAITDYSNKKKMKDDADDDDNLENYGTHDEVKQDSLFKDLTILNQKNLS